MVSPSARAMVSGSARAPRAPRRRGSKASTRARRGGRPAGRAATRARGARSPPERACARVTRGDARGPRRASPRGRAARRARRRRRRLARKARARRASTSLFHLTQRARDASAGVRARRRGVHRTKTRVARARSHSWTWARAARPQSPRRTPSWVPRARSRRRVTRKSRREKKMPRASGQTSARPVEDAAGSVLEHGRVRVRNARGSRGAVRSEPVVPDEARRV